MKKYNKLDVLSILSVVFVISGIIGFIYETIFYKIDLGYYVKRGSTFGPWIPIYGFGSLLITIFSYKFKSNKLIVFIISLFTSFVLEFLVGFLLLYFLKLRLWDYNNEILNYGNIGGFVCLRSVLLFSLGGLLLIYQIIPLIIKIKNKMKKNYFYLLSFVSAGLFILDYLLYIVK